MSPRLTDAQKALFEAPNYAVVTTLRPDGSPHSTVVWIELDEDGVPAFNTTTARVKGENLSADPRVAVLVVQGGDFYRWVSVDGDVELTLDGAEEQIDRLSHKYDDKPWTYVEGQERVTVRVLPRHVTEYGL
ncbi:MAG: PPOX class F420-dependent oxidoreductase [Actinomycetota bacterium]